MKMARVENEEQPQIRWLGEERDARRLDGNEGRGMNADG